MASKDAMPPEKCSNRKIWFVTLTIAQLTVPLNVGGTVKENKGLIQ